MFSGPSGLLPFPTHGEEAQARGLALQPGGPEGCQPAEFPTHSVDTAWEHDPVSAVECGYPHNEQGPGGFEESYLLHRPQWSPGFARMAEGTGWGWGVFIIPLREAGRDAGQGNP